MVLSDARGKALPPAVDEDVSTTALEIRVTPAIAGGEGDADTSVTDAVSASLSAATATKLVAAVCVVYGSAAGAE